MDENVNERLMNYSRTESPTGKCNNSSFIFGEREQISTGCLFVSRGECYFKGECPNKLVEDEE